MIRRPLEIVLLSMALTAALPGQPATKPVRRYLDAYAEWRKLDPTLEREAATAGPQGADRVKRVNDAATKYTVARSSYARTVADESGQFLLWIQNSATGGEIDLAPVKPEQALVSAAADRVTRDIATYSKETDRGFVQLRQALERERTALAELGKAIDERDKAWSKARQLLEPSEDARARAMAQYQPLSAAYSSAAAEAEREEASWAGYYQALSTAISHPISATPRVVLPIVSASETPAGPASSTASNAGNNAEGPAPVTIGGVRIMNPVNPELVTPPASTAPARTAPAEARNSTPPPAAAARIVNPVSAPERTGVIPAVPLARYVGDWTYPASGGIFFGVQPEAVDLEVHEESGRLLGSLTARFKTAAGITPDLQLTFAGDLRATRNQIFNAETSDGAKGTLELIPGNAYNLLEVNFQTEPKPGKLRLVNFVVVKK